MQRALEWVLEEQTAEAEAGPVQQEFGSVEGVAEDGALTIRTPKNAALSARRSASCLLEPSRGDRVLVAHDGKEAFVLSVLTRASADAVLSVEGNVTVRAKGGAVSIVGEQGVSVASPEEISLSAPRLSLRTLSGTVFSESMRFLARTFEGEIERVRVAAQVVDTTMDRLSQRVRASYRTVEDVDHLKANQIDYVVDGNASIQAENTLVTAEKLVKLNGSQVHIG